MVSGEEEERGDVHELGNPAVERGNTIFRACNSANGALFTSDDAFRPCLARKSFTRTGTYTGKGCVQSSSQDLRAMFCVIGSAWPFGKRQPPASIRKRLQTRSSFYTMLRWKMGWNTR